VEASKKERMILLGVVPILAASAGAIMTVLGQRYFGSEPPKTDAVIEILKMQGIPIADRVRLLEIATKGTDRFYSLLNVMFFGLMTPLAAVIVSFSRKP